MMRPRLNPLTALLVTSGVITGALCWGGWRLVMQQRAMDETRAVQQIEAAVDTLAADIRRHVAETGERLAAALGASDAEVLPVEAAVVVVVRPDRVLVHPPRLPFLPLVRAPPAPGGLFAEAEAAEFVTGDLRSAAARYGDLSHHRDPAVQAEALVRLGRVLRKSRDATAAAAAYARLSKLQGVLVAGVPADLLGLYGQYTVLQTAGAGAHDRQARVRAELVQGLQAGRWALARGTAEHYRDLLGIVERSEAWALAEALDRLWLEHGGRLPPRGRRTFTQDDRTVVTLWRSAGGHSAVAVGFGDEFFAARREQTYAWRLLDADGHQMAGTRMLPSPAVARDVGDGDDAWTLQVAAAVPAADWSRSAGTLIFMLVSVLLFVWAATYFIARALRREAAVARLQSDFVAAVSHEFRSPLTTIRQMAEMLEASRVPSPERRQTYYRAVAGEAARLQRLVETLLDFGRLESGAAQYRLATIDLGVLVRGVVDDLEPLARASGTRVEVAGASAAIGVHADAQALAVAVRNLLENAVKYSPGAPVVRVECEHMAGGAVAVRVIDRGLGIPPGERQAIFRKFVRGSAAAAGSVRGTGIGLAMVQQIVIAHGGEVRLESEPGRGSTFTLLLPAAS